MQVKQSNTQSLEKPLISFIVTTHNLPVEMLRECIDSILALSLRAFEREIILVDDGSTESPMGELMDYGGDIVYIRKPNGGVSTARNLGLRMASGTYIQLVDGDDRLIQAPYEHCIDIARFQDADLVMFDFATADAKAADYEDFGPTSGTQYMRDNNLRGSACCCLIKQSLRGELRFTPGVRYGEDEEFTAQLTLRAERLHATTARAYYYRDNAASAIRQTDIRSRMGRLMDNRAVISRLNTLADRLPIDERLALQRRVAQLTMDYIYNVMRLTRSPRYLEHKLESLRREGLFPLPDRDYTTKYALFRRLTTSPRGLRLLLRLIPLIRKER